MADDLRILVIQVLTVLQMSVELKYADLKAHRGLRVFRGYGRRRARAQAQAQAGLVILAMNGLVAMGVLRRRQQAPHPPPSQPEKQAA